MKDDAAYLSLDFLAGFTVFIVAFIWVATMIPGLLTGITGTSIDYDAVAYRTGVILVEDPGMPAYPGWENYLDDQKDEVQRMGFAMSRDNPNILSSEKVNRFFCSTVFGYPDDYQEKVIFGDHPYRFNITVRTFEDTINQSLGDILPTGEYGYIRRFVMVKHMSNATVDTVPYLSRANSSTHTFSVIIDIPRLLDNETDMAYQINPRSEPIAINISNISGLKSVFPNNLHPGFEIRLLQVNLYRVNPSDPLVSVPPIYREVYIDGNPLPTRPKPPAGEVVKNKISILFNSSVIKSMESMTSTSSRLFVNFTFGLQDGVNPVEGRCINSTYGNRRFEYDYDPSRVTQPWLEPGVIEVAVW